MEPFNTSTIADITIEELIQTIKAPDFPTGGTIYGYEGVKEAFYDRKGACGYERECQY
jgi:DNA gyrase/topoisomerase IV subunit A